MIEEVAQALAGLGQGEPFTGGQDLASATRSGATWATSP